MPPTIHDGVAHAKEDVVRQRFRKEISEVFDRAHVQHFDHVLLHFLADEEMSSFDMFYTFVMFWVVRLIDCGLIVATERRVMGESES
eukprot:2595554-Prymnesium_polylepis.1